MAQSGSKGSKSNPYTMSEFESMADAGTWQGGYVIDDSGNVSYVMKELIVSGYSCGSYKSGSGSWDFQFASYTSFSGNPFLDDNGGDDGYEPGGGNGSGGSSGGSSGGGIIYNSYNQGEVSFSGSVSLWGGPEGYGLVVPCFAGNYVISGRRISVYVEGTNSFPDVKYSAAVKIYRNGQLYYFQSLNRDSLPTEIVYTAGHQPIGTCTTDLPTTGKVKIKVVMGASYSGPTGNYAENTSYTNNLAE